ncbi:hypothetical protein FSARC_1692 [Fusarium sarcochroum]|uniref:Nephrocystin 3-like N-terminal domain-containing protein n=1 Tax=Fusarium sarcochroum TaxID=1208366 RepID=A0A8H4XER5_9HYPO|nr:hypothetical protein FSARC_1692 [Fusarium sarcochroum]
MDSTGTMFSNSTSDLYDFSEQLLSGLHALRQSEKEQERPIVFICHSLGGIVFKQASIRAHELERYNLLQKYMCAVLFFGTPHRGSDLANWGTMLSAILKAGSFGTSTNTQLSKDLMPDSRDLERISRSFVALSSTLKVYSFYETEKMDFLRTLSDSHDQRNGAVALQSLLWQLCRERRELIPTVDKHTICQSLEDLEALWSAFSASVQQIRAAAGEESLQLFCILDGLDECKDARKLVPLISDTFAPKTGKEKDGGWLPVYDVRPGSKARAAIIRLRGEDQTDSISADISRVVGVKISDLIQGGLPDDFLESVRGQLIRRADRTFLGKDVLRPGVKTFSDLDYELVRPFENHVKSICGNFVRIIDQRIYLIHETAREFLLKIDPFETLYCPMGRDQPSTAAPEGMELTNSPWQHSFSIDTCEALLLHMCTTFLYMMGRKCASANLGFPSEDTRHLLDLLGYAGKFWHKHFGAIQDRICPRDLRYYQNLCHLVFPGFGSWTAALFGEARAKEISFGRSHDELQDYYVKVLSIQCSSYSADDFDVSCYADKGIMSKQGDPQEQLEQQIVRRANRLDSASHARLSSNPGTLSNYYFPVVTDERGFVSLDLSWDWEGLS